MSVQRRSYRDLSRRSFLASGAVAAGAMGMIGPAVVGAEASQPTLYRSEAGRNAVMTLYERKLEKLTLPHELATVIATEQIYRALSIQRNEPYHRS